MIRISELLGLLPQDRRAHSVEVAYKVAGERARAVDDPGRGGRRLLDEVGFDLTRAALLHDIGYAQRFVVSGFHPIDGAAALARMGYSPVVVHLVALHTSAALEAAERGIDSAAFKPLVLHGASPAVRWAERVLAWADLTTGPAGQTLTVPERLDEILARYDSGSAVARYVLRHRADLELLGAGPPSSRVDVQGVARPGVVQSHAL